MFLKRFRKNKLRVILILGIATLFLGVTYIKLSKIFASTSPWTQNDWSGGQSDSLISTNVTTYKSQSNMRHWLYPFYWYPTWLVNYI